MLVHLEPEGGGVQSEVSWSIDNRFMLYNYKIENNQIT